MGDPTLFWFRRDLRLGDNPALAEAAVHGPVVGLFVVDPALWGPAGPARRAFLLDCLRALDGAMEGHLVIRHGDPARVVVEVAGEVGADTVRTSADFGPYGRRRDAAVGEGLAALGGRLLRLDSPYAVPPGEVTTGSGTPYKVFTPFYRAWKARGWSTPTGPVEVEWLGTGSDGLPDRPRLDLDLPPAGERAALDRLEEFLDGPVLDYAERRDRPGVAGTSGLSPQLKFGCLHPRQILARLGPDPGEEVFRSELAWREFYADVLASRPETAREAYRPELAAIETDRGPDADARFEAWAGGRTGYPIVDAGMRQLAATGWMHNRVRMITASFLVKDLHLDWARGARWFMTNLVDGDLASNSHGWQWVAGTGTDAAPYFRVFNPVSQGRRFDPDGAYIRRWVPELAGCSGRVVHEPWTAPGGPPGGYPPPLVDHGEERVEALARYERVRRDGA